MREQYLGAMEAAMIRLYDLRDQDDLITAMQETSLGDTDLGLAPEPLVGSELWWEQVDTPVLPRTRLEGQIVKVLWGSMADYPEFELRDSSGDLSTWTREGDTRRYVEGLSARVE